MKKFFESVLATHGEYHALTKPPIQIPKVDKAKTVNYKRPKSPRYEVMMVDDSNPYYEDIPQTIHLKQPLIIDISSSKNRVHNTSLREAVASREL